MKLRKKEMSPRKIPTLPPIIIDGHPKSLAALTTKELVSCVNKMLAACLGSNSAKNGNCSAFKYSDHSKPLWWPKDVSWRKDFSEAIDDKKREVILKSLLKRGYNFYQQEETLNLFDTKPNEDPKWVLCEETTGDSVIFSKASGKELHRFREKMQVNGNSETNGANNIIQKAKVVMEQLPPLIVSSSKNGLKLNFKLNSSPSIGLNHSPKRSLSIMSALPKSPNSTVDDDIPMGVVCTSGLQLTCRTCSEKFSSLNSFTDHSIRCKTHNKKEIKKREHFLGMGLVPTTIGEEIIREIKAIPPASDLKYDYGLHRRILARFPFSSETGAMLQPRTFKESEKQQKILHYEIGCSKSSWDRSAHSIKQNLRPPSFQNIHKSFGDYDELDFNLNKADWISSKRRRKAFHRLVSPCKVIIPRLCERDLLLWCPEHRKTVQSQTIRKLRANSTSRFRSPKPLPKDSKPSPRVEIMSPNVAVPSASLDHTRLIQSLETMESEMWRKNNYKPRKSKSPRRNGVISPCRESLAVSPLPNRRLRKRTGETLFLSRGSTVQDSLFNSQFSNEIAFVSTVMRCHFCEREEIFQHDGWLNVEFHAKTMHASEKFCLTTSTSHDFDVPINSIEIREIS